MTERLSPAVFVDRDGTLIEDRDYCSDPKDVKLVPGAAEALRNLKSRGFKVITITNQSGIGRGMFTLQQYRVVETEVLRQLGPDLVDATYFCADVPGQQSTHRKPAPGMILQAAQEHAIDLSRSFMIGDKESDVQCAHNAGVRAIRVKTGPQTDADGSEANWVADNLSAAADIIVNTISTGEPRSVA